ncbi:MAG: ABC transporter permease [Dehalobacter sp. 4CP]|uniref:ABC transporter permease n=1 Tax=Dehalobacter sp. CP TaxID=2594474 RepID=UPI0013CCE32C|nr:ABC transporter permease [Dehalobacter sp. 4CP]
MLKNNSRRFRPPAALLRYAPALFFLVVLLAVWQFTVNYFSIPHWLLPSPSQIGKALWNTRDMMWGHTKVTIIETTLGLGLAVALGMTVSTLMTLFPLSRRVFYPFLIISQTIPLIAVAPLLLLWLGYGVLPKILIVVLVCFFPIAISLLEGLELSDLDLLHLLQSMGASKWQVFSLIRWPHAMPALFSGLKIAAAYSVMTAVISEWLGASQGLGVYLLRSSNNFLTDRVFAAIIAITALSFFYYAIIIILTRLLLPWYSRYRRTS